MKKYYDIWQNQEYKYIYHAILGYEDYQTSQYKEDYLYLTTVMAESPEKAIEHYYAFNYKINSKYIILDISWIPNFRNLHFDQLKMIWIKQIRNDFSSLNLKEALSIFKYFYKNTNNFTVETLKINWKDVNLKKSTINEIEESFLAIHQNTLPVKPDKFGFTTGQSCLESIKDEEQSERGDYFYNILQYVKSKNKPYIFYLLNNYSNSLESIHSTLSYVGVLTAQIICNQT